MTWMTITSVSKASGHTDEVPLVCAINIQTYFEMENVDSVEAYEGLLRTKY